MRGDKEENVQNTPKDVLTVNKININLMLTVGNQNFRNNVLEEMKKKFT